MIAIYQLHRDQQRRINEAAHFVAEYERQLRLTSWVFDWCGYRLFRYELAEWKRLLKRLQAEQKEALDFWQR